MELIRIWSTKAPRSFWKKRDKLFVLWLCGAEGLLGAAHVSIFHQVSQRAGMLTSIWKNRQRVLSFETIPPAIFRGLIPDVSVAGALAWPGGRLVNVFVRGAGPCGVGGLVGRGGLCSCHKHASKSSVLAQTEGLPPLSLLKLALSIFLWGLESGHLGV